MSIENKVELTEDDIKKIKQDIGRSPCICCADSLFCCGCPEGRDFDSLTKDIKPEILTLNIKYHKYLDLLEAIKTIRDEKDILYEELYELGVLK